ncbi:hypothetical protein KTD31_03645 [Burkholderia multivorans]|uniref:hypothetical protein n=1 Tax=Burkholderia multivorans TaxID=87883 RepID=UPI001C23D9EA|nr:hypothetical protein [Burkholderia multivorans]MBU9200448.1 hypothetical protein [Burkholderia multivorans]
MTVSLLDAIRGSRANVEPDTSLAVGDRVRSYDFAHTPTCYVEGRIEEITAHMDGCPRYMIRVEKRVFDGLTLSVGADAYIYPPVNGIPTRLGGITNLVERADS